MRTIKRLWLTKDEKAKKCWQALMIENGLATDEVIDYTLGVFEEEQLVATASYAGSVIKCVAVKQAFRSENLLGERMQQLLERLREENRYHVFLYTKQENRLIFQSLGFKEIIATKQVLFMEQGFPNLADYLKFLGQHKKGAGTSVVLNANPFTLGHQYLIETAAKAHTWVYVFVLSEDGSLFSPTERLRMVQAGVKHLDNVVVLPTWDYLVSGATFPAYFLKERNPGERAKVQAGLDALLFKEKIAPILSIKSRYVGEEPLSPVTNLYNEELKRVFGTDLKLTILPRLTRKQAVVSGTKVRQAFLQEDFDTVSQLVPATTLTYLKEFNKLRGENQWKSNKRASLAH